MKLVKNMRLRPRLITAFAIVALFSVIVGAVGVLNMQSISTGSQEMFTDNVGAMEYLALMYDTLGGQRICLSNVALFYETDNNMAMAEKADLANKEKEFEQALEAFRKICYSDAEIDIYDNMYEGYTGGFARAKQGVIAAVEARAESDEAYALGVSAAIKEMDSWGSEVSGFMDDAFAINEELAIEKLGSNQSLTSSGTTIITLVTIGSFIISGALGLLIAATISAPLGRVLTLTRKTAETGNLNFDPQTMADARADSQYKDEIGQMVGAVIAMMEGIIQKAKILETIASGDLTVQVPLTSPQDTLGVAEQLMIESLSTIFGEVGTVAGQVSGGASQIADGSQMLAQGSTQQAAAVEQLSASIGAVAESIRGAADSARHAAQLAGDIKEKAEAGTGQMNNMVQAVQEINEASQSIGRIIAVIDKIAFQTNILALNASVEAARAGQHGRGFAVVAEEVRSLATQSAAAAKDTGALIENSIAKAELGVQIAAQTSASLDQIVTGINESSVIVAEIARSAEDQSNAITQINTGIDQVAQVVQQNSATAQQSAAASQQMSSQSTLLRQQIARIKLAGQSGGYAALPGASGRERY